MKKWKPLVSVAAAPAIAACAVASVAQPSQASSLEVFCKTTDAIPEVVARPNQKDTPLTILAFLPKYFAADEALQQCQSTATTLQSMMTQSSLEFMASDTVNGLPTVCSVERRGVGCDSFGSQVLFTLSESVDPSQALYDMLGSNFKQGDRPDPRTVSRIYTRIGRSRGWWPF